MATTKEIRQRIQVMRIISLRITGEAMLEHKEEIAGLLVHQQYEENVDSEGQLLREYSFAYKTYKRHLGKSDDTTLNLTGEFQQGITLAVQDDTYSFDSPALTDEGELKSNWLNRWNKAKGGGEIMKLTEEKKPEVWRIIFPTVVEKAKEVLQLG